MSQVDPKWPPLKTGYHKWEIATIYKPANFLSHLGNSEVGWTVIDEYTPAITTVKSVNVDIPWLYTKRLCVRTPSRTDPLWNNKRSYRNYAPFNCDFLVYIQTLNKKINPHIFSPSSCLTHLTSFYKQHKSWRELQHISSPYSNLPQGDAGSLVLVVEQIYWLFRKWFQYSGFCRWSQQNTHLVPRNMYSIYLFRKITKAM